VLTSNLRCVSVKFCWWELICVLLYSLHVQEFVESPNHLHRNRSVGSNARAVPQIPVEYPTGVSTERRRTVPDLPLGGCTVPQGRPLYVNESTRRNQDLTKFPWYVIYFNVM
jgi:hypothetical protein